MTFNSVWLSVLTMLPSARRLAAWLTASLLLLGGGAALAANDFDGGKVTNCTLDHPSKTYSCSALSLPDYNTVTSIASGYTVVVGSTVALGYNQTLQMSGSAKLQSSGDIDLAGVNGALLNISGGTLAAAAGAVRLGNQTQAITANVNAQSVSVGSSATRITGTVTATGAITTGSNVTINGAVTSTGGAISLGSDTAINGAVNGVSISTGSNVKLSSTLSAGGAINLGSGNTINGAVNGASIKTSSGVGMGALTVTGAADLGSANTINGKLDANSLKTDSGVTINGAVKTQGLAELGSAIKINGGVDAGSVKTGSPGQINGGILSKSTVDLGSGLTITGNVAGTVITSLSPVNITGNVAASTSFTLPSGSTVNGNVTGGALTILDGGSTINGNVTMTGNVYIGSSGRINGDLKAYDVNTHASDAIVSGNAAVHAIYLDFGARVNKTITCTGAAPGLPVCSCVTKAESSYMPTCSATPPAGGAHHLQITHSGTALTCQPQTVTLTACANANCTAPHYTAAVSGTLSPGNLPFTIAAGNGTGTGLVQQTTTTAPASLSAASASLNASTCVNPNNSTAPCAMTFSDKGLIVTVPDHVSMASGVLNIEALQAQNNHQSCVPLLKDAKRVAVSIGCNFSDPINSAAAGLAVTDRDGASVAVSCGSSTTSVTLDFDGSGKTTATLKYPEVGVLGINAKYTSSATPAFYAVGNSSFTVAPFSIGITAARVNGDPTLAAGVFARAGEPFKLTLTARNSAGNPTKNFGTESTKENFLISPSITIPIPSKNPKGEIKQASITAIKDGSSDSVWSFSDVGSIKMSAAIAQSSTYYMNKLVPGFNPKAELTLGRFIPDHFDTMLPVLVTPPQAPAYAELPSTQLTGVTMKCANASSLNNPCTALDKVNGRFIYSKQPFYVVVKAYNMQSALTQNYSTENGLAGSVDLSSWTASGGTTPIGVMAWKTPASPPKLSFVAGVGVVGDTNLHYFDFGGTASVDPTSVYVRAIDNTDKVTSRRTTGAVELPLTAVSGRMMVANNYGSQSSALPVEVQAQYWASNAGGYVLNPAYYSDLQTIGSNRTFDNCKGLLSCGALTLKADKLTFVAGKATLQIAPPLASGSANLTLNPAGPGWENFYLPSSTGRATFGIYRSGPVIYTREVHN